MADLAGNWLPTIPGSLAYISILRQEPADGKR
jgi:hypothetical protein